MLSSKKQVFSANGVYGHVGVRVRKLRDHKQKKRRRKAQPKHSPYFPNAASVRDSHQRKRYHEQIPTVILTLEIQGMYQHPPKIDDFESLMVESIGNRTASMLSRLVSEESFANVMYVSVLSHDGKDATKTDNDSQNTQNKEMGTNLTLPEVDDYLPTDYSKGRGAARWKFVGFYITVPVMMATFLTLYFIKKYLEKKHRRLIIKELSTQLGSCGDLSRRSSLGNPKSFRSMYSSSFGSVKSSTPAQHCQKRLSVLK